MQTGIAPQGEHYVLYLGGRSPRKSIEWMGLRTVHDSVAAPRSYPLGVKCLEVDDLGRTIASIVVKQFITLFYSSACSLHCSRSVPVNLCQEFTLFLNGRPPILQRNEQQRRTKWLESQTLVSKTRLGRMTGKQVQHRMLLLTYTLRSRSREKREKTRERVGGIIAKGE